MACFPESLVQGYKINDHQGKKAEDDRNGWCLQDAHLGQAGFRLAGRTPVRPAEQPKEGVSLGHFGQSHGRDRFDRGQIKEVTPLDGEPGDVCSSKERVKRPKELMSQCFPARMKPTNTISRICHSGTGARFV